MDLLALKHLDPRAYYYENYIKKNERRDRRHFTQSRRVVFGTTGGVSNSGTTTTSTTTCGEALVHVGATAVACTVSVLVGTPHTKHPGRGDMDFDVGLFPLCSLKYESRSNKPDDAHTLEHLLHEVFVVGRAVNMTQLCIEPGRFAYRLAVRLVCISEDGNLVDAAVLAVTRALLAAKLPRPVVGAATVEVAYDVLTPLQMNRVPVSVTCGVFTAPGGTGGVGGDVASVSASSSSSSSSNSKNSSSSSGSTSGEDIFLVDPCQEEEAVVRGTVTCVIDAKAATQQPVGGSVPLCLLTQVKCDASSSCSLLRLQSPHRHSIALARGAFLLTPPPRLVFVTPPCAEHHGGRRSDASPAAGSRGVVSRKGWRDRTRIDATFVTEWQYERNPFLLA